MKIEINTDKTDNKIKFRIDNEEYKEFDYKSLDIIISRSMSNNEEIEYVTEEKLEDYETLIKKLVQEARSDDFKNAVELVISSKEEYKQSIDENLEEN